MGGLDPFGWVGSVIDGQFEVEAVAGEGAFGLVYRGRHAGFDLPIAIKCLKVPPGLEESARQEALSRFREEARILHRLSTLTTGVVQALHTGATTAPNGQWTPYLVMEWVDGVTLQEDLARRAAQGLGPRSLDESLELLEPIARALAVAHRENVSHRDVKPANVFLARSYGGTQVKLVDFGIAKVFAETPSLTVALAGTASDHRPFTPQYGAPEQFSPRYGATGPWTDVFALGLLLVEIASGRPALSGSDVMQLFVSAADEDRRPSLIARGVPASPGIEVAVQRALAVTPALRFLHAGEMWAEIAAARGPARPPAIRPASAPREDLEGQAPPGGQTLPDAGAGTDENRICTIMSVDLSEATELSARLEGEEVKDILERCVAAVREGVEELGGVAFDAAGDRVTAVFGMTRATEADAERAVLAALRVQTRFRRVSLPRALRSTPLSTRIGITTGRIFIAASDRAQRQERSVIGDAVNSAARLQQSAPRGAVVVGRDTYRSVAGLFEMAPLEAQVAGSAGTLPAYRVVGPVAHRHPLSPSDFYGLETALVGRSAEKQRLLEALDTVVSESSSRIVTLVGPAGVGRSRLLSELYAALLGRERSWFVIAAQCTQRMKDTSYGLAAALLRQRFEIRETEGPELVRRKLERGVRLFQRRAESTLEPRFGAQAERGLEGAERDDALTQVASILGLERSRDRSDAMVKDQASSLARHRISAAASGLLRLVAAQVPVAIFCDDLQWADDASLSLLDEIATRDADLPILIVCSARPDLYERWPHWGEGKPSHERVDVGPLPRRHLEEMLRDRLRHVARLSPELVQVLCERADCNPLTLVETLHLLVDAGVIEISRELPWLLREERLGALTLPATVQGIAQARIDRLSPEARDAVLRAAVIGRTFWEGALDRLRREEMSISNARTVEIAGELRTRQILRAREPSTFPGEREYVFAESPMHEAAYEMLSSKVRRRLHLLAAEWLKSRTRGSAGAALLALHYDRGHSPGEAASEYARAGAHAVSLGENKEALRHLQRATALHDEAREVDLAGVGTGSEDRRIASWIERVRVRLELGDVLRRLGSLDDAERAYADARTCIVRVERRRKSASDATAAQRWDARVDLRMALVHRVRGSTAEARDFVERAIARALTAGARDETLPMFALLTFLHRRERRPDDAWRVAREGLRVCRSIQERGERWREDTAEILFGVGAALFALGRMAGAERSYRQALRLLDEAKNPHLAGIAYNGMAAARLGRGDRKAAREMFVKSLRVKERVGDLHQIAVAYSNLAEVELPMNDLRAAMEHARRAVDLGERIRAGYDLAEMYRNLADALLATGDVEGALSTATKALRVAEVAGRVYLGDVALTLARVCAKAGGQESPEGLRSLALEGAAALRAVLRLHVEDPELRRKAAECDAILAEAGIGGGGPAAPGA